MEVSGRSLVSMMPIQTLFQNSNPFQSFVMQLMDGQRKAQAISSCGNTNPCLNSQMIREKLVYYTCIYLCTVAIISY